MARWTAASLRRAYTCRSRDASTCSGVGWRVPLDVSVNERGRVACVAGSERNHVASDRRKIDGSTCIRDTALCRTDEPLGRLTFFHAAAAPRIAPLITNTVSRPCPSFSLARTVHLASSCSFSHPSSPRPARSLPRSLLSLSLPLLLPVRSPVSFTLAQRPFFHPLAPGVPLLSSAMSSTCRTDDYHEILYAGVPYYPRLSINRDR